MKRYKIIIASFLIVQATLCANELSWVDTQVDAIKPPRVGISNSQILKVKDPFIFYKKESPKKQSSNTSSRVKYSTMKKSSTNASSANVKQSSKSMQLSAIINHSALINGEWYRVDQNIAGFTISSITRTNVVLTKGKEKLVLTTNDQKRNLKFK